MDSGNTANYVARAPFSSTINWADINFPPFFKVVHFNLQELQGGYKRFALKLYLGVVILLSVILINSIFNGTHFHA